MDVARVFLGAVVCFGFTGPIALAQTDEEVTAATMQAKGLAKPWRHVRGFGRVLDLRNLPVVIDQPGLYAIDRNWDFPDPAASAFDGLIQITADNVTLDLHGFAISADPNQGKLLMITGSGVEVRDGSLLACCTDGTSAVQSTQSAHLHHLTIYSYETMKFEGGTVLTDSNLSLRVEIQFAGSSSLQRNTIDCNRGAYCVRLLGEHNRVTDNKVSLFQGGGIRVVGDRNFVANNIIDESNISDVLEAFVVEGDNNVVRDNTVLGVGSNPTFVISGTANTLDGNILAPLTPQSRAGTGMRFTADGNYYGDNRMAAQVPFDLGGTAQTSWGGNVGY